MRTKIRESKILSETDRRRAISNNIIKELKRRYLKTIDTIKKLKQLRKQKGIKHNYSINHNINQHIGLFQQYAADYKLVLDEIPWGVRKEHLYLINKIYENTRRRDASITDTRVLWAVHLNREQVEAMQPLLSEYETLKEAIFKMNSSLNQLMFRITEAMGISAPEQLSISLPGQRPISRLDIPYGIDWAKIIIRFIDPEEVEIIAGGKSLGAKNFEVLGFRDRRKKGQPDKLWNILTKLAQRTGEIGYDEELDRKEKINLKKDISLLRKRLKALFGLDEDPFHPYDRKSKSYRAKFLISARENAEESQSINNGIEETRLYEIATKTRQQRKEVQNGQAKELKSGKNRKAE
jgi:hypothetical protein